MVKVAQYPVLSQKEKIYCKSGNLTDCIGNWTCFPSFPHVIHNGDYGLKELQLYIWHQICSTVKINKSLSSEVGEKELFTI